jgi:DNA-binding transcriptional LysR family regulator
MISASPRRLSVFKEVVEAGGFNLAAARLGIAQPSVGAHVTALEQQLGQPLFYRRRGRKPQLTKAGEALYAFTVDLLRMSEATSAVLTDLRSSATREITIAAHRDIAQSFLPTHLAAFAKRHPRLRIVTHTGTIEDVLGLVRAREAHLALFMGLGPVVGLQSDVLTHVDLCLVVAPGHELARRNSVDPEELAGYPFVTGLRTSHYFQIVDTALRKLGLPAYEIAMELQDFAAVRELARHGAGIACLAATAVTSELRSGTLVELKMNRKLQQLELRCAYEAPLPAPARSFVTYLRKAAGEPQPG